MRVTKKQQGFSLIEVMISLALGVVVVMLVVQLFINAKNNHAQNDRVSETLESGRFALRQISTDLKEAGFFGGITDTSQISTDASLAAPTTDCGVSGSTTWAYDVNTYRSIQYDDTSINSAENPLTDHTCINSSNYQTGTDALVVKRVFTSPDTSPNANTVYLRSDYNTGCLWLDAGSTTSPTGGTCPTTGTKDWQYLVHVYYIQNHYQSGDGIPTLCRKTLDVSSGKPTMQTSCLAPGIEKFHIMFGIDTDTTYDGVANEYISDPTQTQLNTRVVSARIYVLAQALQPDSKLTDTKTYTMGDLKVGPFNDKYYRRLFSTTVILHNPMYTNAFN